MIKNVCLFLSLLIGSQSFGAPQTGFKKPTREELKKKLTPLQYSVTQEEGTEKPFDNEYWNNKKDGIYVDVVSGEPLFSSSDKYDSGTGWPSFTKPLVKENIVEREDKKLFSTRTEVRSKNGDSHLGHVFNDGPQPTGMRYCMNSAALRFIAAENLVAQGYGEYATLFKAQYEYAIFAGGCFWCMEPPFEKLSGVVEVISGYTGGTKPNPTYKEASSGTTGHTEAVQVKYDPTKISYDKLLEVYWRSADPTDNMGQFVDRGTQYRPGIFYLNDKQKEAAEKSKDALEKTHRFDKPIVAEITKAGPFYPAEEYHQDYYKKNPVRYKYYRYRSGRDQFLEKYWGNSK